MILQNNPSSKELENYSPMHSYKRLKTYRQTCKNEGNGNDEYLKVKSKYVLMKMNKRRLKTDRGHLEKITKDELHAKQMKLESKLVMGGSVVKDKGGTGNLSPWQ